MHLHVTFRPFQCNYSACSFCMQDRRWSCCSYLSAHLFFQSTKEQTGLIYNLVQPKITHIHTETNRVLQQSNHRHQFRSFMRSPQLMALTGQMGNGSPNTLRVDRPSTHCLLSGLCKCICGTRSVDVAVNDLGDYMVTAGLCKRGWERKRKWSHEMALSGCWVNGCHVTHQPHVFAHMTDID